MASPTYTTKANFKTQFGIDSSFTADDSLIDNLLAEQETFLQAELGYTFGEDTDRIDEWVAAINRKIIPPKIPISSITTLKVSNMTIDSDYYDISEDAFYIWLDDNYAYGRENVEVYLKYTAGYDTNSFPEVLKRVIKLRAGEIYNFSHISMKSGSKKEGQYGYPEDIRNFITRTVDTYKLHKIEDGGKI